MRKRWKFDLIFRESGKQDLMGDNYLRATRVFEVLCGLLRPGNSEVCYVCVLHMWGIYQLRGQFFAGYPLHRVCVRERERGRENKVKLKVYSFLGAECIQSLRQFHD